MVILSFFGRYTHHPPNTPHPTPTTPDTRQPPSPTNDPPAPTDPRPPTGRTPHMNLVTTEDRDAVRHVVLNRPDKRNAMSQALLSELADALRTAGYDDTVHCVVLRGEGPVFSAGVDLGELMSFAAEPGVLRPFRNVFLDSANLCEEMPKPVVC